MPTVSLWACAATGALMAANIAEMARMWFRMLCSLAMKRAGSPARNAIQFTERGIVPQGERGTSRQFQGDVA
jgi:hypothetical protein